MQITTWQFNERSMNQNKPHGTLFVYSFTYWFFSLLIIALSRAVRLNKFILDVLRDNETLEGKYIAWLVVM